MTLYNVDIEHHTQCSYDYVEVCGIDLNSCVMYIIVMFYLSHVHEIK